MLQDISIGRLENEYRIKTIEPEDCVLCFQDGNILLTRDDQGLLSLPAYKEAASWEGSWQPWNEDHWHYAFRMLGRSYFLYMGVSGNCPDSRYFYQHTRQFRELASKDTCFAMVTGWHLYQWYRSNRFCGCCGTPTVHDEKERMVRCPACGNMIFPRINPAVIVAVTDGDRLLMSKYAGRSYSNFALIAGFAEIGETLEQTVHREVMEEVGLKVKNLRYFNSQPWGIDGNLLSGFFCDLDGDDTIHLDEQELSLAEWHRRDSLPAHDDGLTLTRAMIGAFENGTEPK